MGEPSLMGLVRDSEHYTVRYARYWHAGDHGMAVVAVISKGIDWAAYVASVDDPSSMEDCIEYTVKYGSKLSEDDARHFFPDIGVPYRI